MRLISALLCLCLTFNVMAASGTIQELERALDEYQYSLTVDWDQKDPAFMTEKTEAFYKTLSELMEKGLTENEIMNLVSKKSKNPKEVEALAIKIKMLTDNVTSTEGLAQVITENSKSFYSTGASWDGYYVVGAIGVIAFVAILGYSIWFSANRTCVATAQGTQCGWVSQFPNGPQFYQCWETTYCTEYVKN